MTYITPDSPPRKCETFNCERTDLVWSGVDALMLGLPFTERFCYACGNAYHAIAKAIAELPKEV